MSVLANSRRNSSPASAWSRSKHGDVDIDHPVPLKEAHQSGAHAWDNDKRRRYANDLDNPGHLNAVDDSTNQSKGDKDPAEWLPPNEAFHCAYVVAWIEVKKAWQLSMDQAEADRDPNGAEQL